MTAEHLAAAPRLKGVLKHGVGTDNIDVAACTARGVPGAERPRRQRRRGGRARHRADVRAGPRHPGRPASVTSGGWERGVGRELGGKTLGIVGLGNIGRLLAQKALGLGMTVDRRRPLPGPRPSLAAQRDRDARRSKRCWPGPTTSRCTSPAQAALIDAARLAGDEARRAAPEPRPRRGRRPRRAARGARVGPPRRRGDRRLHPGAAGPERTRSSATPTSSSCRIPAATRWKRSSASA